MSSPSRIERITPAHPLKSVIDGMCERKDLSPFVNALKAFFPGVNVIEDRWLSGIQKNKRMYSSIFFLDLANEKFISITFRINVFIDKNEPKKYRFESIECSLHSENVISGEFRKLLKDMNFDHFQLRFRSDVQSVDMALAKAGPRLRKWYEGTCSLVLLDAMDGAT